MPLPPEPRAGVPSAPGLPSSRPQSIAGLNGLASQSSANLLGTKMTGRDPKSRARSKEYLKQCLQEVNYLTSPQAVNPLPNRPLVDLGPTTSLVGANAQNMGQQENQHQQGMQQPQSQQPQQPSQHLAQHQPIAVALPNLPPFPPIGAMNDSGQQPSSNDNVAFNGRPRKLVPEVGKDFPLNGALEPSLMPESVGAPRDQVTDPRAGSVPEPTPEDSHEQPAPSHEGGPVAPIPLDEPELTQEQESHPDQRDLVAEDTHQDTIGPAAKSDSSVGGLFSSDRNLVTAIFRPDSRGDWKKRLQEAHDEAMRAGATTGLESISLRDEFDVDEMDGTASAEDSEDKAKVWKTRKTLRK